MDFEVQRCSRHCSKTSRELEPDEVFFSALIAEGSQVVRYDFCQDAWQGPPEGSLGWWKSRMPGRNANKLHWAPNDIMLNYFIELQHVEGKQDVRYVLALLMVRRRVLRLEDAETDEAGNERLVLYCPRSEETFRVPTFTPDEARTRDIQEELAQLLFADAA